MGVSLTSDRSTRPGSDGSEVKGLRVLVVDDEPLIGTTLRILLDEHDVEVANSGEAARARFEAGEHFDVILCDLMLNDLTGMELARWMQDARPDMSERLVFMTGGAFTDEARSFLRDVPETRRLEKPFSTEEIMRLLRSV